MAKSSRYIVGSFLPPSKKGVYKKGGVGKIEEVVRKRYQLFSSLLTYSNVVFLCGVLLIYAISISILCVSQMNSHIQSDM